MLYYSYTQTFSLILLYCWYSYCVSFCALFDGVCLSGNKRIIYLLTYLLTNAYIVFECFPLIFFPYFISYILTEVYTYLLISLLSKP